MNILNSGRFGIGAGAGGGLRRLIGKIQSLHVFGFSKAQMA